MSTVISTGIPLDFVATICDGFQHPDEKIVPPKSQEIAKAALMFLENLGILKRMQLQSPRAYISIEPDLRREVAKMLRLVSNATQHLQAAVMQKTPDNREVFELFSAERLKPFGQFCGAASQLTQHQEAYRIALFNPEPPRYLNHAEIAERANETLRADATAATRPESRIVIASAFTPLRPSQI